MPAIPKPPRAPRDPTYVRWVRTQVCCLANQGDPCLGPTDPHHAGKKPGMRIKAPDRTCIALCRKHHDAWEDLGIPFKRWPKAERQRWALEQIQIHQTRYDSRSESDFPF